jgi:hypothetical protein
MKDYSTFMGLTLAAAERDSLSQSIVSADQSPDTWAHICATFLDEGYVLAACCALEQAFSNVRVTNNHFSISTYIVAERVIRQLVSALIANAQPTEMYPTLFNKFVEQSANQNVYTDFSVAGVAFHPHAISSPESEIIQKWIRQLVNKQSTDHTKASMKNVAIVYLLHAESSYDAAELNSLLQAHKEFIFLKDYYTLFSLLSVRELCNAETVDILSSSLHGLAFLIQYQKIYKSSVAIPDAYIGKVYIRQMCVTAKASDSCADARVSVKNLLDYYLGRRFGPDARGDHNYDCVVFDRMRAVEIERKAPVVSKSTRELRIAICVSGQLRGYEEARRSWRPVEQLGAVSYFVHTWRNVGGREPEGSHAERVFGGDFLTAYMSAVATYGYSSIKSILSELFERIRRQKHVSADDLMSTYDTRHVVVEDENDDKFIGWNNYRKMYYKISKSLSLVREMRLDYDIILRIRPDKKILSIDAELFGQQMRKCLEQNIICADSSYFLHFGLGFCVGDQFYMGSSALMLKAADMYEEMQRFDGIPIYGLNNECAPHINAANVFSAHNIEIELAKINWGPLVEPEKMSADAIVDALAADLGRQKNDLHRKLVELLLSAARRDVTLHATPGARGRTPSGR